MPAVTETLRNAQILAEFSNLQPDGVEYFRHNYPDFVPEGLWDYYSDYTDQPQWQFAQMCLRDMWKEEGPAIPAWAKVKWPFPDDLHFRMLLTLSVFDPEHFRPRPIHGDHGDLETPTFADWETLAPEDYYPYHKAVFFLFENPWRARICLECKKRFVATSSQSKYCGETCSHVWRNRQKLKWYYKEGKKQREARQKKGRYVRLPKGPK